MDLCEPPVRMRTTGEEGGNSPCDNAASAHQHVEHDTLVEGDVWRVLAMCLTDLKRDVAFQGAVPLWTSARAF